MVRHAHTFGILIFLCVCISISTTSWAIQGSEPEKKNNDQQSTPDTLLVTPKTLTRQHDPIIIKGDLLPSLHGLRIENFRLFAHDGNGFIVIPFQIDERDAEGAFVYSEGEVAGTDVDKGLFDYNDELVFMAQDSGGQVEKTEWTKKGNKGAEILITDPLDVANQGWAYLVYFSENPPSVSEKDYVTYLPEQEEIHSAYYTIGYSQGAPLYNDLSYTKQAGGSGEDFLDRIKIRISVKTLLNLFSIFKTEEDMRAKVIGWKDGPVRVLRNTQNFLRIFFNLAEPSILSVSEYYSRVMYTPVRLTIPFNLKWVFNSFGINDWTMIFYGDFHGLIGGKAFSNRNLTPNYYTGNHSPEYIKKNVNLEHIIWGFLTKDGVGTWFPRLVLPDMIYEATYLYTVDDETLLDPPEDVPGVIAGGMEIKWKGIDEDLWFLLPKGSYQIALDTYFPRPGMEAAEANEWLNIRDFPIAIDINEMESGEKAVVSLISENEKNADKKGLAGMTKKKGSKDKGFTGVLTDIRGRQFHLNQISSHFGSSQVTPRSHIIGRDLDKREYHRIEFEEINQIEHYLREKDPITELKNTLVQKMIMNDGKRFEMVGCKPCGYGGLLPNGDKIFFYNTQISSVKFNK